MHCDLKMMQGVVDITLMVQIPLARNQMTKNHLTSSKPGAFGTHGGLGTVVWLIQA